MGVASYEIYRNDVQIDTVSGTVTSYTDNVLAPAIYTYYVRALDAAGNRSDPSNTDTVTMRAAGRREAHGAGNLTAALNGTDQVDLNWEESSDNVLVTGYRIYRNDDADRDDRPGDLVLGHERRPRVTTSTSVRAEDAAGNLSDPSNPASVIVPDTESPAASGQPHRERASTAARCCSSGTPRATTSAIAGYEVYRDGAFDRHDRSGHVLLRSGRPRAPTRTTSRRWIRRGTCRQASNTANVTVLAVDTEEPGPPANLQAQAGPGKVDLQWDAATDNRAVTDYEIRRNGTLVATDRRRRRRGPTPTSPHRSPTTTRCARSTRPANVSRPEQHRERDGARHAEADAAHEPDAASATASQVDLTWGAAGDDVAVTRIQGSIAMVRRSRRSAPATS